MVLDEAQVPLDPIGAIVTPIHPAIGVWFIADVQDALLGTVSQ